MSDFVLRRFDHGELTLLVREYGDDRSVGGTRAFVLVHGIGASSRYYARLSRLLAPHGSVYAVDLPGFGAAPSPAVPLDIPDFAALLRAFAGARGLVDPVLVGHSMGSQVVTEVALQDPGLASSLVLIAPVVDPAAPSALGQALRLLRDVFTEPPAANWIVAVDYLRCGPRRYFSALPAMLSYRLEERVARLQVSTLVIRGSRDPVTPAGWADRLVAAIPRSSRLDVRGASHVVQLAAPRVVVAAIVAHARIGVAGSAPEVDR
ncbi:alpha/beta fold hydrolase [Cryobacterium tagatosivorans]|uniref:Alpha/beta hydrolase n=1 Tax=Cryobacterium tagatosivorans TaxID=1259199 RepID=A0A4R8UCP8_9MICO|nr:alpha/beta hydrolase [Cryobacterium tagatosivorans]TFB49511.1 alpha/beta hydrolase [Cryobacterium tagatosivorans]